MRRIHKNLLIINKLLILIGLILINQAYGGVSSLTIDNSKSDLTISMKPNSLNFLCNSYDNFVDAKVKCSSGIPPEPNQFKNIKPKTTAYASWPAYVPTSFAFNVASQGTAGRGLDLKFADINSLKSFIKLEDLDNALNQMCSKLNGKNQTFQFNGKTYNVTISCKSEPQDIGSIYNYTITIANQ